LPNSSSKKGRMAAINASICFSSTGGRSAALNAAEPIDKTSTAAAIVRINAFICMQSARGLRSLGAHAIFRFNSSVDRTWAYAADNAAMNAAWT